MLRSSRGYRIIVDEPWDFSSLDGKNIITGLVLSILDNEIVIFKSNYQLNFNGLSGDILILFPRQKNESFEKMTKQEIDVNGGLLLCDYNIEIEKTNLKENSKFVLIGTISSDGN